MHRYRLESAQAQQGVRLTMQILAAALFNGYAVGFAKGRIFTGKSKMICVPVLNCYSCPGVLGACPIGSMQAVIGASGHEFPFYVLGLVRMCSIEFL